ncbi:hypothetical protein HAX54_032740 [Datura stramonium]|uniref:Uncharacterized protein n=1 Tax=Datura stramonium TaxID=4076 RepID=A0ABS8SDN4_DATST|nr:hypothetical protein [Datura stramonium]
MKDLFNLAGDVATLQHYIGSRISPYMKLKRTPSEEFNFAHTEALAIEAAIVIYSYYDEEMDMTTEIDHLQLKFNHFKPGISLIISSLSPREQEDLAREINRLHFQLLLKFKFVKAAIRQMCPGISASSTLDHTTVKSAEFFFLLTLRGFRIVTTEEESVMCLSYEDAVDSDKCRKVNLVLRFLTTYLSIKSEGSLMDLIKHKASLKAEVIDLIESSHEELALLRAILMDLLKQHTDSNKLDDLLMHAEVNARKLARISGSCYGSSTMRSNNEKNKAFII